MNSPKKSSISSLNLAILTLPIFLLISLFILFPSPQNAIDHPSKANVFVTFHIRNEQILENVRQIQRALFQANPKFLRHFQPIPSLHVTLILCALNASNFEKAKEALDAAALRFVKEYSPSKFVVHFEGIQHFGNSTLFGALQNQSFLQTSKLFDLVKTEFEERGMPALGQFPVYHPHMSLVDLGAGEKAEWLAKYWPKIEAKWREKEIGVENVEKIQICSMDLDEWSQDYKVLYEVGLKN